MSQDLYKTTHKQVISQPLLELEQISPMQITALKQSNRWRQIQFDQHHGIAAYHPHLIGDILTGRDIKLSHDPWGDPAKLGNKSLNLRPFTQRLRPGSSAMDALQKHQPNDFFERWLPWTEAALKKIYQAQKEESDTKSFQSADELYKSLRSASLMIVGRTVCSMFRGELLNQVEAALEGIDTAYARVAYTGARTRFGLLQNPDVKQASQSLKSLEATIRPIIRDQIGGGDKKDDLLTRWVHTKGIDGRSLKEDQVMSEAICFLMMAYTSLPKILFGAITNITMESQSDFLEELSRETNNVVKLITSISTLDEGTPPPITPHNESAWKTIPLHNAIVLEALRLYPPNWLSQYRVSSGVLPLGSAQQDEERGPTTTVDDLIWLSPWGSHHNSESFPKAERFWPQRWSGNLENQLPLYSFAPFGYHGQPSLSEVYCKEVAARFLMMWFARYNAVDIPSSISWELSICLRPSTSVQWLHKRDYVQQKSSAK